MWLMGMSLYISRIVYSFDCLDNMNRRPPYDGSFVGMFEYMSTIAAERLLHIQRNILIAGFPI